MKITRTIIYVSLICLSFHSAHAAKGNVYMSNGKLYFSNAKELTLWGVNFQPCLSWEYNQRFKNKGIPLTTAAMKPQTIQGLDELQRMGINLIRVHLTPVDFTDANGNLVTSSVYLQLLDHLVSEAKKRNIYMYVTLINHMGYVGELTSIFNDSVTDFREKWIFDQNIKAKSKTYITALLNRVNPYTNIAYKADTTLAMFELLNEPRYYNYNNIKNKTNTYYKDYLTWLTTNGTFIKNDSTSFAAYRTNFVKNYINEIYTTIRNTGAVQPIIWNCNWSQMYQTHADVFAGVAQSSAEVVSFSVYPGFNLMPAKSWINPIDLSNIDFTNDFKNMYNNYSYLGWAKSPDFAGKAKVCYEYEQIFNHSSYLYPLMAQFLRSLGVQTATMWTYNFGTPAIYAKGSHVLSLTCTPPKAASFMVAHEVFDNTPLYTPYIVTSPNERIKSNYAYSKAKDLSMFVSADKFYYTDSVTNWLPITVPNTVTKIIGRGYSPLVNYTGSGIYSIQKLATELNLTIEPNYTYLQSPIMGISTGIVTSLDSTSNHLLSITLNGWGVGKYGLYRISSTSVRTKVSSLTSLNNISLAPGKYVITKDAFTNNDEIISNCNVKYNGNAVTFNELSFDHVRIYSLQGTEVLNKTIQNENHISLSKLTKGVYIVSLSGMNNANLKITKD